MVLQLTLSCDEDKTDNGPTLIHSTGVQDYKIPPEVIRILQESLTNDLLSDHADGVLCQVGPQRILDVLRQNGFNLQNQSNDEGKALWIVVQNGHGDDADKPNDQNPRSSDDKEADGDAEDQGGDDEGEGGRGGGEEEEEEE